MHTRVVRQYESVASYIAVVTPTGFKLKRIQKALFCKYFLHIYKYIYRIFGLPEVWQATDLL